MNKLERINVSMSSDFIKKLDKICEFRNCSRSKWIRHKIDEELFDIELLVESE